MTGVLCAIAAAVGEPLSVGISPTSISESRVGAGSITSSTATATADGGAGGYTYAWAHVSGDSYTINSPSSAGTTFTTSVLAGQLKSGVYRCTVTDSASSTATADITVALEGTV